ncbi:putative transposase of the Rover3 hAT-like family [Lachancea nothofagi CBS 11611]|uniref:Putative transposase of the Rover3 hAT-like family n=1 Tax=Lachancea nothofagi CBS 11611 TaxID=1266666 RepID=A0A1G4K233_9SACH|nr:putative transposase of the Rover3 hAT-like family [Lachancea nothofagi CBS 11611]
MEQRIIAGGTAAQSSALPNYGLCLANRLRDETDDEAPEVSESTLVEPRSTGWMQRSSLRKHFEVSESDGVRIATCIHCGRTFKERKSTGNLSKHVKNLHPRHWKSREVSKNEAGTAVSLNSANTEIQPLQLPNVISEGRLIPLPGLIATESAERPVEFFEIALLIEKQLPFSIVTTKAWKWLSKACPGLNSTQPSTTTTNKLATYIASFDDTLFTAMASTDTISLVLDIHSSSAHGKTYLAIWASFVPNLNTEELLPNNAYTRCLSKNIQEPFNTHLLDLIDVAKLQEKGEVVLSKVLDVCRRFNISHKITSVRCCEVEHNLLKSLHSAANFIKIPDSVQASQIDNGMGNFHLVKCVDHVLEVLLRCIIDFLKSDGLFETALDKIANLAELLKESTILASSLSEAGIALIPLVFEDSSLHVWKQIDFFLKHRDQYMSWVMSLNTFPCCEYQASELEPYFEISSETQNLLQYFVDCCSIFSYLGDKLQVADFNQLSNAAPIHFTLKAYYEFCHSAVFAQIIAPCDNSFDFSFINGDSKLSVETKGRVLKAVNYSLVDFSNSFGLLKQNIIYFVATFLDPTFGPHGFHDFMTKEDADYHLQSVETYVKRYLENYRPAESSNVGLKSRGSRGQKSSKLPRLCLGTVTQTNAKAFSREERFGEWDRYVGENQTTLANAADALSWWCARRTVYSSLFPLAVSLLVTKISCVGVKDKYPISAGKLCREAGRFCSKNAKQEALLKDRFYNFGLCEPELNPCDGASLQELSDASEGELENLSDR